jgi:hypothetical protein
VWKLFLTPSGGVEIGPSAVKLTQNGTQVDGAGIAGTVTGTSFAITSVAATFTTAFLGTIQNGSVTGTFAITGSINAAGTFRLERFTPTGTFTANGTLQTVPVAISETTAAGVRDFSDPALTALVDIDTVVMPHDMHFAVTFGASGLTVGTLGVPGTVTAEVLCRDDTQEIEVSALGGTVTVTQYDANGFAGSYSLMLPGGDTLTGTFDVVYDIDAYSP